MQHFGIDGYRDLAARTRQAFEQLRAGIEVMLELKVLGQPHGPLLGYGSRDVRVNIFAVGDQMDAKGWQVNRLQFPDGLHAVITARHLEVVDEYLRDLRDAVAIVRCNPGLAGTGRAATCGMMAHLPLRGVVKNKVFELFANAYRAGGAPLELNADAGSGDGAAAAKPPLLQRVARWYVARQQRR